MRPVRTDDRSSFAASTAFFIRSVVSVRTSEITGTLLRCLPAILGGEADRPAARTTSGSGVDERSERHVAADGRGHVARPVDPEHDHVHAVVHAEAERGRIDHLESLLQGIEVGDPVELDRMVVDVRVGRVDAVDAVLRDEHDLGAHLQRTLSGDGVGREVRKSGARAEDHDAALLHVPDRAARDVRLRHLGHGDRGLHARLRARLLEEVLQRERVHHRAEHAHVVGAAALHAALLELRTAEEVAPTDHDRDLDGLRGLGDLAGEGTHDDGIDAESSVAECLPGKLEEYPSFLIGRHTADSLLVAPSRLVPAGASARRKGAPMALAGPPQGPVAVPTLVSRLAGGAEVEPVWANPLGGLTFRLADGRYAKWAPSGARLDLLGERDRLR